MRGGGNSVIRDGELDFSDCLRDEVSMCERLFGRAPVDGCEISLEA